MNLIKCGGCEAEITERDVKNKKVIGALDRLWHVQHLCCIYCKVKLDDKRVLRSEVSPFHPSCYDCYLLTNNPACIACLEPVAESAICALGCYFHRSCFKCSLCHQIIQKGAGFYEKDYQIIDHKCYVKRNKEMNS